MGTVRPSHLLHLAWVTTPGEYWTSLENERWREASVHLVREFIRFGGRRVVVAGTCAEYDWSHGICDEATTPMRPATLYGRCKHALHLDLVQLTEAAGRELAWARLFFLYGPGEHRARLVPGVIESLLRGQPALCTPGTQQRDFLHVSDAAEALVRILMSREVGAFNVASGTAIPVAEVVGRIGRLLGASRLIRLGARPASSNEPALLAADVCRIRALDWNPRFGLTEGLEDTIAWWRRCSLAA
jgi:nucleoside-diphosphate-sugar epimerase